MLKVVGNPEGKNNGVLGGIDVKTVVLVTVLTTVASQFVIDAYRHVKKRIQKGKEGEPGVPAPAAANPLLPPQQIPMYAGGAPAASPWAYPGTTPGSQMPAAMGPPHAPPPPTMAPAPPPAPMGAPTPPVQNPTGLMAPELEAWQQQLERRETRLEEWQTELDSTQRHLRLVQGS